MLELYAHSVCPHKVQIISVGLDIIIEIIQFDSIKRSSQDISNIPCEKEEVEGIQLTLRAADLSEKAWSKNFESDEDK